MDPTLSQKIIIAANNNNINPSAVAFSFMKAVWTEEKDISNEETIKEVCKDCNLDFNLLIEQAKSDETNNQYTQNTEEAMNNNVWGSPTFIYNSELFWGQDRIEFLERAIQNN